MQHKEIEDFCKEHGFLFHQHGSGTFGADRYWSYVKVENNDRMVFSIEYFPVRNLLKINAGASRYQGSPESLAHVMDLFAAMRINLQ